MIIDENTLRRRVRTWAPIGGWVAAVTDGRDVVTSAHRSPASARVEIGSVSKGLTGLLYADACDRGEISAEDTLGDHLPLGDAPAASVTLGSLTTHRSGLPALPDGHAWSRSVRWLVRQQNPYGDTLDELVRQARATRVGTPRPRYSNLGFELLGHAVAAAAGTTYPDLVADRLATPLGLSSLTVPTSADQLGAVDAVGRGRWGRRAAPWTGEGLGPAGGVRMTIEDAGRLVRALLDGSAPGLTALDPGPRFSFGRIGAAWMTSGTTTWHNGATGGFRSWLGVDRERGVGCVVVRTRYAAADRAGQMLLSRARRDASRSPEPKP